MILTEKQNVAVNLMSTNFKLNEPVTVISGYAGTGKSSIINYFIEGSDLMDSTRFVTYTGKASLVLQNKGLPATTIHKLIYDTYKNYRTGKFIFKLKKMLSPNIRLIVIDEVSMVPMPLLMDLMSFNIPLICLGDPGQLEPIGQDNGLLASPNIFLEEIHRQAQDNSIIKLSMLARNNQPLPLIYDDPFVKVINRSDVTLGMLTWADQILCSKNATRRKINEEMRTSFGFSGDYPVKGDKVICLHNYWDYLNEDESPLINGTIGNVTNVFEKGSKCIIDFKADYSDYEWYGVDLDTNIFKGLPPISTMSKSKKLIYEFDFGYAITVHKSQGSSYQKVLVYEEYLMSTNHARLLYTAITRAEEKLIIVKAE